MPDRMDQSGSIVHVDDGDNASCLMQKGLPELFQETNYWQEEHYHFHSAQHVALPLIVGGQIDDPRDAQRDASKHPGKEDQVRR